MRDRATELERIWKKIYTLILQRNISQNELLIRCQEKGYYINQPDLSKLFNGRTSLNLYQYMAFCDVLGLNAFGISEECRRDGLMNLHNTALAVDPALDVFKGFFGTYHCFFISTDKYGDKIHKATLCLKPSSNGQYCKALFELPLPDERDESGNMKKKLYYGQMVIASTVATGWCILEGENVPELSVLAFRHRSFVIKNVQCRLALALTTSSGSSKTPTCHKIFIVRDDDFDIDDLKEIEPYLRFAWQNQDILVPEKKMEQLFSETTEKETDSEETISKKTAKLLKNAFGNAKVASYYEINEDRLLRANRGSDRKEIAAALAQVLGALDLPHILQIVENDDERTFELLDAWRQRKSQNSDKPGN